MAKRKGRFRLPANHDPDYWLQRDYRRVIEIHNGRPQTCFYIDDWPVNIDDADGNDGPFCLRQFQQDYIKLIEAWIKGHPVAVVDTIASTEGAEAFFVPTLASPPVQTPFRVFRFQGTLRDIKAIKFYFSPSADLTAGVVEAISEAKESVLVQAYSFTFRDIADALKQVRQRGINVQVILNGGRSENDNVRSLLQGAGIPVYVDDKHSAAHNKVMVIDETTVITGSFNFTEGAKGNAENMLVIQDKRLAKHYKANWERCRAHSDVK